MIIGRICYGIFSKGYQVSTRSLITKYFQNAELFLAMSLTICTGRLATSLAYWIFPLLMSRLRHQMNLNTSQSITVIMMLGFGIQNQTTTINMAIIIIIK
eukprot:295899_1